MESVNAFFIDPFYEWNLWMFSLLILYMNGLCECCFINPLYEWNMWMFSLIFVNWMESVNVFFIVCLYKWNMWMCWFFIYIICLYEWTPLMFSFLYESNLWILSLSFANMNGICDFFFNLCIWMESVNVFFIVC